MSYQFTIRFGAKRPATVGAASVYDTLRERREGRNSQLKNLDAAKLSRFTSVSVFS
ncbi:hypothetical protein GNE08_27895 (plasmid) [Trichormus variabilis ARAD]|uniref:Uncharacterized protein n=1 Tax=Trichormus variabilis N2B TaxID=2681315 RepID=A0ABR6SGH3_ANAVA|nr:MULTISPECIES: hypothetical protein [Nostocaceae]MBC1218012.1 hypothetical protein [Trichormus variabilis ARAD]MBC1259372.1 hypothetical protein [Trichormus variabilis V5]MBC1305487.1 hypothetical protein [Trichormus variabilis N2B]QHD83477.1 hypothetical protein GSQ19_26960 [Trichormus variabilis 0441]